MIEINNLTTSEVDENFIRKVAEFILKREKKEGDISIALIGQNRIRKINKFYRGRNRVTDVLSFRKEETKEEFFLPKEIKELGEILLCLRELKKRAKRKKSKFEIELSKSLIHGILHLLGYTHKEEEKAKVMREKEEKYLKEIIEKFKLDINAGERRFTRI
jgi:probable rRNA maturation factor